MNMYAIIEKKRDGKSLTEEEINYFIKHVTNGDIPDYQTSALLMAIYFQGMTKKELSTFTLAMANSGDTVDLSKIEGIKVDKHSTGGVGDTTTLILAPLVASTGIPLAKMSGRGLGHTGGTLDKLESIPGFNIELTTNEFIELVNKNKVAVMGQSGNITPADKKLYSLRDVTATVNSIPLIASSVMSKKIAAGSDAIVLDVETGAGAFMKTEEEATELAQTMVGIGNQLGRKTMAVISNMSEPLGNAVGNALEVKEAVATLKGKGPDDLTELCLVLGSQMVVAGEKAKTMEEAREMLEANIANGKAIEVFKTFITAQGGDEGIVQQPGRLPQAEITYDLKAKSSGYIEGITANEIGRAAMMLGAGRDRADATIDMAVGIVLHKKVGEFVKENESLLTIHANQKDLEEVKELLYRNIKLTNQPVTKHPLILGTID